jgi:hypothetical protein
MTTRLFVLLAREEKIGLVFRRGPSKQVLLVRWNLTRDTFERGQWFKGRIYEHRCDLSPRGDRLVYFAASWRPPFATWTAVSRPPYLTALALWPKGDAWGGGGLFESQNTLLLNHPALQRRLADGFAVPSTISVRPLPLAGRGEDDPIHARRMRRDGWTLIQEGREVRGSAAGRVSYRFDPPELWAKGGPAARARWQLRMYTDGVHERQGPWYVTRFGLGDLAAGREIALGRADWADWAPSGDLLLARAGKILRIRIPRRSLTAADVWAAARELVDLSSLAFEPREAPPEARRWIGPPPPAPLIEQH